MKDIIYFDQDGINSILAQLNAGYIEQHSTTLTTGQANVVSHSDEAGTKAGVNAIFQAAVNMRAVDNAGETLSETSADLMNKMIGDYALDLLLDDETLDWSHSIESTSEGDLVDITTNITLLDFNVVAKLTDPDSVQAFINSSSDDFKEYKKLKEKKDKKKEDVARLKKLESSVELADIWNEWSQYGRVGSIAFPNSIITSFPGGISFSDDNKFRLNKAQMFMLNQSKRKARIIGQVTQIQENVRYDGSFPAIDLSDYPLVPSYLFEILLGGSALLQSDDRIIKALAIYFE
ncbi:hypothetical protein [Weissella confusa]|uniref:DUF6414 family protein n=1 Tax=Weissella confusa TaxID=1583 RepID=UPI002F26C5A8